MRGRCAAERIALLFALAILLFAGLLSPEGNQTGANSTQNPPVIWDLGNATNDSGNGTAIWDLGTNLTASQAQNVSANASVSANQTSNQTANVSVSSNQTQNASANYTQPAANVSLNQTQNGTGNASISLNQTSNQTSNQTTAANVSINQTTAANASANYTQPAANVSLNQTQNGTGIAANQTANTVQNQTAAPAQNASLNQAQNVSANASVSANQTSNQTANVSVSSNQTQNASANYTQPAANQAQNASYAIVSRGTDSSVLSFAKGGRLQVSESALAMLENDETVRVMAKSKGKIRPGSLRHVKSASPGRNLEVFEINRSALAQLADLGAEQIYVDAHVSAALLQTIPLIGADRAQAELGYSGEGVAICLLDTGVDFALASLGGKAVSGYDFVNADSDASDDNGHGTIMASVIHAAAPQATIYSVKVLDATGSGYESDVISGIDYCRQLAGGSARVISMSFGGGSFTGYCDSGLVAEAVNDAAASGLFVSASAGNGGSGSVTSPACASGATAVSSTTKSDAVSIFSNMNGMVDLLAPGDFVSAQGMHGTETRSGTSISAAHVSGAAALLFQSNPGFSPAQAEQRFRTTGTLLEYGGATYPRIEVYNAIANTATGEPANQSVNQSNGTGWVPIFTTSAFTASSARTSPNGTQEASNVSWIAGYCNFTTDTSNKIAYNYTWWVNGTIYSSGVYSEALYSTILGNGRNFTYEAGFSSPTNANDSDYATKATYAAYSNASMYWNYTNPANSTNNTAWQTKHGTASTTNDTLPSGCASQQPIRLRIMANNSNSTALANITLLYSSFETAITDNFTTGGTSPFDQSNAQAQVGSFSARKYKSTAPGWLLSNAVDTSSCSMIYVQFGSYDVALDSGGDALYYWIDNLGNNDLMLDVGALTGAWANWANNSNNAQYKHSNFRLNFSSTTTLASNEYWYIDNVTIWCELPSTTNYSQTSKFCWDGGAWASVGTNSTATNNFNAADIYEQDLYFNTTSGGNESGLEVLANNLTATFSNGQNWTFMCNASDGTTTSSLNSSQLTLEAPTFVDTSISASTLSFGSLDPGTVNSAATENPIQFNNTENSNVAIDIYLNNSNMTNDTNFIPYYNLSVNTANDAATATSLNGTTWINGTAANTGFYENLAVSSSINLYFWHDVPVAQQQGYYTANVTIRAVADGDPP